jgi:TM2 domain-containing membrane protein YozV
MNLGKFLLLLISINIAQLSSSLKSYAAFVVKKESATSAAASQATNSTTLTNPSISNQTAVSDIKLAPVKRDRTIAAVLAILLGSWGAHRFYMGQNKLGFIRLGITIFAWMLFLGGSLLTAAFTTEAVALFAISMYVVGYVILLGGFVWNVIDFARILSGEIQPDGGFEK